MRFGWSSSRGGAAPASARSSAPRGNAVPARGAGPRDRGLGPAVDEAGIEAEPPRLAHELRAQRAQLLLASRVRREVAALGAVGAEVVELRPLGVIRVDDELR